MATFSAIYYSFKISHFLYKDNDIVSVQSFCILNYARLILFYKIINNLAVVPHSND